MTFLPFTPPISRLLGNHNPSVVFTQMSTTKLPPLASNSRPPTAPRPNSRQSSDGMTPISTPTSVTGGDSRPTSPADYAFTNRRRRSSENAGQSTGFRTASASRPFGVRVTSADVRSIEERARQVEALLEETVAAVALQSSTARSRMRDHLEAHRRKYNAPLPPLLIGAGSNVLKNLLGKADDHNTEVKTFDRWWADEMLKLSTQGGKLLLGGGEEAATPDTPSTPSRADEFRQRRPSSKKRPRVLKQHPARLSSAQQRSCLVLRELSNKLQQGVMNVEIPEEEATDEQAEAKQEEGHTTDAEPQTSVAPNDSDSSPNPLTKALSSRALRVDPNAAIKLLMGKGPTASEQMAELKHRLQFKRMCQMTRLAASSTYISPSAQQKTVFLADDTGRAITSSLHVDTGPALQKARYGWVVSSTNPATTSAKVQSIGSGLISQYKAKGIGNVAPESVAASQRSAIHSLLYASVHTAIARQQPTHPSPSSSPLKIV